MTQEVRNTEKGIQKLTDYGEFCSLTQEQLDQFSQRFAQPETFRPEELENAFWMEFHTF